jgi:hypothetical protein
VIVHNLHIVGVPVVPDETNAVLIDRITSKSGYNASRDTSSGIADPQPGQRLADVVVDSGTPADRE